MQLLDGKKVAQNLYEELRDEVARLQKAGIQPKFALILIGEDPASLSYIKQKRKASQQIGVVTEYIHLKPEEVTNESMLKLIEKLNQDPEIFGILVQLPMPQHLDKEKIIRAIDPKKDVDGFLAVNVGEMFLDPNYKGLSPCTPLGVMRLLDSYKIDVAGKDVTMVGASNIVGKPLAVMLMNRGATVTVCHVLTKDLKAHTKNADIVIVAVGKPKLITADMLKDGVVVVDVGMNRHDDKLCGDVDFEPVAKKAAFISPVPGGVGPMTVACLMENIVKATKLLNNF